MIESAKSKSTKKVLTLCYRKVARLTSTQMLFFHKYQEVGEFEMDFVEYMSELETIGEILDQRCQTMDPMEYVATHGVDNALLHRMQELIPIARQVMTNDELRWGKMNYLRIQEIRECSLPDEEKILLGTIYYAASVIGDEKRFRKYFERYRAD